MTDVPDWTQSVNIQNAEIPVAGGVTIDAGQSGVGVFVGSLEYPQQVNSSYRLSATVSVYTETVPLFTLTTSIGVVVYPAIPPNFAVGTTVTVSVVGGITGVVYADEVQLQYGEGAQVTVAISGALEVNAVVTVTYSTPSLNGGVPCFFIGTFGPPGPLASPNLPAPSTAGWINLVGQGVQSVYINASIAVNAYATIVAGVVGKIITVVSFDYSLVPVTATAGGYQATLMGALGTVFMGNVLIQVPTGLTVLSSPSTVKAFPTGMQLSADEALVIHASPANPGSIYVGGTVQFVQA